MESLNIKKKLRRNLKDHVVPIPTAMGGDISQILT